MLFILYIWDLLLHDYIFTVQPHTYFMAAMILIWNGLYVLCVCCRLLCIWRPKIFTNSFIFISLSLTFPSLTKFADFLLPPLLLLLLLLPMLLLLPLLLPVLYTSIAHCVHPPISSCSFCFYLLFYTLHVCCFRLAFECRECSFWCWNVLFLFCATKQKWILKKNILCAPIRCEMHKETVM